MTQRNTWRIIVLRRVGEPSTGSGRTYGDAGTSLPNGSPTSSGAGEPPRAFTLVELLVVIGILALLAALLVPTVMTALRTTRNAAIRSEINMLQMAMLNYQSEYGVLPPAIDSTFNGAYRPSGEAFRHLKRLFPRCPNPDIQLNDAIRSKDVSMPGPIQILPNNAIVSWLDGYTVDPINPLLPSSARVKLYDFDRSRVDAATLAYHPSGAKNSPYFYVDSAHYGFVDASRQIDFRYRGDPSNPSLLQRPGTHFIPKTLPPKPAGLTDAWYFTYDAADAASKLSNSVAERFNEGTFQILCAGRDGVFGNDDDLSNFWPGTRSEYLDALKKK